MGAAVQRAMAEAPAPVRASVCAVARLSLSAFRSYETLQLHTDRRPVALFGPNGAGKTNILEAISLLTPGRGLRGAGRGELGRRLPGEPAEAARAWAVAADIDGPLGAASLGIGAEPQADGRAGERRLVRVNGAPAPSSLALGERIAAVWLTPAMDRLFLEGAGGRRRFLDRLTFAHAPGHARAAAAYERAQRERLRLLKQGGAEAAWLDGLEAEMARHGLTLTAGRAACVAALSQALGARADAGPFPAAALALDDDTARLVTERGAEGAAAALAETLARRRRRDAEAGRTTFGPHTADLGVTHLGRGRPAAECSTGEQKALLIAIVLAAARCDAARPGAAVPLLLLDEVAAHLDAARREALAVEIADLGAQAWMTGTDPHLFAPWGDRAQGFAVAAGRLSPHPL